MARDAVEKQKDEIIRSWRQIYAILKETGYDTLYEREIALIADTLSKSVWGDKTTKEE